MEEFEAALETGGAAAAELAVSALLERGGKVAPCPNCSAPVIGAYCSQCGQPVETHRRSVLHLLHDFVKDIASFDSRILRTARALLFEPGELPVAFREGRTQRYVPPVRLYLFVSLLFFLFLSGTGIAFLQLGVHYEVMKFERDQAGHVFKLEGGKRTLMDGLQSDAHGNITIVDPDVPHFTVPKVKANGETIYVITTRAAFFRRPGDVSLALPPDARARLEKIKAGEFKKTMNGNWYTRAVYGTLTQLETDPAALNGPLMTWIPRILFFLLPLFALLLVAFYWRRRNDYYFVDHMVFSLSMHTFAFVVLIVAAVAAQLIDETWVAILTAVALAAYLLLSLKRFYRQSWLTTGLKFAGIGIIYPLFFLLPALGLGVIVSMFEG
jgi:Protein of unknown function (DUF3667)